MRGIAEAGTTLGIARIPQAAKWFLADVVEAITVGTELTVVVHINTHLIRAGSPEEALHKGNAVGRRSNRTYQNIDGERVTIRFLGLRDGAEIKDAKVVTQAVSQMSVCRESRIYGVPCVS